MWGVPRGVEVAVQFRVNLHCRRIVTRLWGVGSGD